MPSERSIDLDTRVWIRTALWLGGLLFLWYARHIVLLAFAGILFAVFFDRLAGYISRVTHSPHGLSLAIVVVTCCALFVAVFWLRGSQIADEAQALADQVPKALQTLSQRLSNTPWAQWLTNHISAEQLVGRAGGSISSGVSTALGGLFGATLTGFLIVFLTLALAATPDIYRRGFLLLFPPARQPQVRDAMAAAADTLWWWLLGRLLSMTFVGVATGVGLWLLHVPLAFVLAVLAALLSFIPNFGPVLSAIPAILLAAMQDPKRALYVIALYVGVQAFENYVLDPVIDRKTVYLPPALTVVTQLVLALAVGILGAAFAAPFIAAAMVITQKIYVRGWLGNRNAEVTE